MKKLLSLLLAALAGLIFASNSVAALANFSDPYQALLPPGYKLADSAAPVDLVGLKQQRLALVVGPNFEDGVKHFNESRKFQANMNALIAALGNAAEPSLQALQGRAGPLPLVDDALRDQFTVKDIPPGGDPVMESSSPTRIATHMVEFLSKIFGKIDLHSDLASARDSKAEYIGVFDFGFIRHSMTDWTRVAKLDLLTPSIQRLVAASSTYRPEAFEMKFFENREALNQRMIAYHLNTTNAVLGGLKADFVKQLKDRAPKQ
jgi:hypothetical protein